MQATGKYSSLSDCEIWYEYYNHLVTVISITYNLLLWHIIFIE